MITKKITQIEKYDIVAFFKDRLSKGLRVRQGSSDYGDYWYISSGGFFGLGERAVCIISEGKISFYESNPDELAEYNEIVWLADQYGRLKNKEIVVEYTEYV